MFDCKNKNLAKKCFHSFLVYIYTNYCKPDLSALMILSSLIIHDFRNS